MINESLTLIQTEYPRLPLKAGNTFSGANSKIDQDIAFSHLFFSPREILQKGKRRERSRKFYELKQKKREGSHM